MACSFHDGRIRSILRIGIGACIRTRLIDRIEKKEDGENEERQRRKAKKREIKNRGKPDERVD